MKNLSLFVSAFALCASTSYAAINCNKLPSCADLGYVDKIGQCPSTMGPDGNWQRQFLKCPFSNPSVWADTEVKCLHSAEVGQIGYFTAEPGRGWLKCDGSNYSNTKYPQLAKVLGTRFGGTANNTFNVPNYQGYFLRIYGTPNANYGGSANNHITTPQKEQLPNITGGFTSSYQTWALTSKWPYKPKFETSAFNCIFPYDPNGKATPSSYGVAPHDQGFGTKTCNYDFDASKSNTIYAAGGHVIPANYAVFAYIYAGLTVE